MNLTQLNHFVTLSEHGSFRLAAETLGISQPALTKSISKLEDNLGVQLLNRARGRNYELTIYGRMIYEHGIKLLKDVGKTRQHIELMKKGHAGQIRIGFGTAVAPHEAARIASQIQENSPECLVHIRTGPQHLLLSMLRRAELDCIISSVSSLSRLSDFNIIKLWKDPFQVFVSHSHELAAYEHYNRDWAANFEWLSSHRLINADTNADRFLGHSRDTIKPTKFDVFDPNILAKILAQGKYLSAWPSRVFEEHVQKSELKGLIIPAIKGENWVSEAHLIYKKGVQSSAIVQAAYRQIQRMDFA